MRHKSHYYPDPPDHYKEICGNCGFPNGDHHAGTAPWPYNYCPGTEGRMNWEDNKAKTIFAPTGKYKEKNEPVSI